MRVIAGEYRRRTLVAPPGLDTRPTSDRLRETLFNILAPLLPGASFLDLYAGSGANGIEAISRGASRAVFVEQAAPALAAIRANLTALQIPPCYSIEPQPVATWLRKSAAKSISAFDILFLDPPYDHAEEYTTTLGLLGREASRLLGSGAAVVVEHRRTRPSAADGLTDRYGLLERTRLLEQGDAALSFFAAS